RPPPSSEESPPPPLSVEGDSATSGSAGSSSAAAFSPGVGQGIASPAAQAGGLPPGTRPSTSREKEMTKSSVKRIRPSGAATPSPIPSEPQKRVRMPVLIAQRQL